MNCERARELLSPYLDQEIEEPLRTEVESHVSGCPRCTTVLSDMRRTGQHIAAGARLAAPAELGQRVRDAIARERTPDAAPRRIPWRPTLLQQAAAVVFACVFSGLAGWQIGQQASRTDLVEHDLVTAHMRSLAQDMPLQVASTDQHTVKPWFAGKIAFSPVVKDLSAENFALIGARLDFIGTQRAAVLVYKRREHWIDVYVAPVASKASASSLPSSVKGYNIVTWTRDGLSYWAISDLNAAELHQLRDLLQS